jgi:hypothetical protein
VVAGILLATLALVGCGGAARARLVVTQAHMTQATITDKTKCKQISATKLLCDGVEVTFDGTVQVEKK